MSLGSFGIGPDAMERRGSKQEHDRIVKATLILLGKEAHAVCRVWDSPCGVAYRVNEFTSRKEWIAYGHKGGPDIEGILLGGRWLGIEIKSGKATQQQNQVMFEMMINRFGGLYILARSPEEALESVLRAAASCN